MTTPVPTKQPASLRKKLGWAAAILIGLPVLWTAVFWQEITVYREFKRLCATDAGLKVFEKLEPGQVWEVSNLGEARGLAEVPQVGLARSRDESGKTVDVKAISQGYRPTTTIVDANLSVQPRYEYALDSKYLSSDPVLWVGTTWAKDHGTKRTLIVERQYLFMSSPRTLFDSLSPFDHPWYTERCPEPVKTQLFLRNPTLSFR